MTFALSYSGNTLQPFSCSISCPKKIIGFSFVTTSFKRLIEDKANSESNPQTALHLQNSLSYKMHQSLIVQDRFSVSINND